MNNNIIKDEQIITINIDDSGKLVASEKVAIYAGLIFINKKEKEKFITQYRSIVNSIKCKYCKKNIESCNSNKFCPELKHNMLKPSHNRQLLNYIKKYTVLSCIINNDKVFSNIKEDKASRGRFLDYALKRLIKNTIKGLIKENKIDPNKPIKLILNIDEQTTKTNGYYNLKDGIVEELKYGIYNFNYDKIHPAIIFSDLKVIVHYQKSDKSYLIQAADLVAGTIRKLYLNNIDDIIEFNKRMYFVNYKLYLP